MEGLRGQEGDIRNFLTPQIKTFPVYENPWLAVGSQEYLREPASRKKNTLHYTQVSLIQGYDTKGILMRT